VTPLAALAAAVRHVHRLLAECPEKARPRPEFVFADVGQVRDDVVELTREGRDDEAHAIVADWEREAGGRVASRLLHSPLDSETRL
jgi:hypothetical protein